MENRIKSLIKKLSRFGYYVKPKNTNHMDPVCGMKASGDLFKVNYQGKSYYFCSSYCKQEFKKDPEDYIIE